MKLVLCYKKSGQPTPSSSHEGIGNTCRNTANVLKQHGYCVDIWPIAGGDALEARLLADESIVTHVVIAAPFIPADWMLRLAQRFPQVRFSVTSHSNVGFLQAESAAIRLMRRYSNLAVVEHNFFASANNLRLVQAFNCAYGRYLIHLPNLYDLSSTPKPKPKRESRCVLNIGSFGALRVQKNFTSAAWAAIGIARKLRLPVKFHINMGRTDNNGNVVEQAIRATIENVPGAELVPVDWLCPMDFRSLLSQMDLLIQPSYTETFSMVTADAIAEMVPVVVTEAMEWCPQDWKAESDDVVDICNTGIRLLRNAYSAEEGYEALQKYNEAGTHKWKAFLQ